MSKALEINHLKETPYLKEHFLQEYGDLNEWENASLGYLKAVKNTQGFAMRSVENAINDLAKTIGKLRILRDKANKNEI